MYCQIIPFFKQQSKNSYKKILFYCLFLIIWWIFLFFFSIITLNSINLLKICFLLLTKYIHIFLMWLWTKKRKYLVLDNNAISKRPHKFTWINSKISFDLLVLVLDIILCVYFFSRQCWYIIDFVINICVCLEFNIIRINYSIWPRQ